MAAPFMPRRDGRLDVRLGDHEADAIRRVAADLLDAVGLAEGDEAMRRLFPPAYADDAAREAEFERMTRSDLVDGKVAAARAVVESIDAGAKKRGRWTGTLDDETAGCWLGVINDARLILGTRLDVTEEMEHSPLPASDPRAPTFNLYLYLGALEEALLDALAGLLPAD